MTTAVAVVESIKALIRPVITLGLVAAFIRAAFVDPEVAVLIGAPMGIALGFWFNERRPPA